MKHKMIKQETSKAKFRVFKNRFSSYILQKKDKGSSNKEWKIVNAFATPKLALNYLQGTLRTEMRADLKRAMASVN